jgi:hypothetical protein
MRAMRANRRFKSATTLHLLGGQERTGVVEALDVKSD